MPVGDGPDRAGARVVLTDSGPRRLELKLCKGHGVISREARVCRALPGDQAAEAGLRADPVDGAAAPSRGACR